MKPESNKARRAQQIAQCLTLVSAHFKADPAKVLSSATAQSNATRDARHTLWYHLHDCGMSYHSIGRLFGRSETLVGKGARLGVIRLMGEDRAMIERLPRIETTLEITEIQPTPAPAHR